MKKRTITLLFLLSVLFYACDTTNKPSSNTEDKKVLFTKQTRQGVYEIKIDDSKAIGLLDETKSQRITSDNLLRIVDFSNLKMLEFNFSLNDLKEGDEIKAKIRTFGINDVDKSCNTTLYVNLIEGSLYYLEDEANGLGYIVSK